MNVERTALDEVLLIRPTVFADDRGYFLESWNSQAWRDATGLDVEFVQDNHSHSRHRVLRGLHYQQPQPQGKLVRCAAGAVWDVAVDIRRGSPTFGQWTGETLSAENQGQLWIPPGFAHGFLTLSESADVLYKTTEFYVPEADRGIRWDDPTLAIDWPLDGEPILSAKDASAPLLVEAELSEDGS